jgi:hypothetical protein
MIEISVKKDVRVDYSQFATHIAIYQQAVGKTLAQVVKNQSRLFCRDMCDYTPPFSGKKPSQTKGGEGGFGSKARNKGRDAVSRDVRKIFAPIEQASATAVASEASLGAFSAWVTAKLKLSPPHYPEYLFKGLEKIGTGAFLTQTNFDYFKEVQGRQGRQRAKFITNADESQIKSIHEKRRGSPSYRVRKTSKSETVYVDNWRVVEKYIKKVQYRVGRLKSGWYYAGKQLGPMPTSAWIAGQGSGDMIFTDRISGPKPNCTIGSKIGRRHSMGYHFFRMAMNHRAFAMRVQILKHLSGTRNHPRLLDAARKLQGGFNIETK